MLTTVIMAPTRVEPWVGAPKKGPFSDLRDLTDLRDLRDRIPGASFGCTEIMVSPLLDRKMTSDVHIILIFTAEFT